MVRWDAKSKDAKDLENMFKKGMIASDAKASSIRETNPGWKDRYDVGQFRNAFNRIKGRYGAACLKDPPITREGKVDCYLFFF